MVFTILYMLFTYLYYNMFTFMKICNSYKEKTNVDYKSSKQIVGVCEKSFGNFQTIKFVEHTICVIKVAYI